MCSCCLRPAVHVNEIIVVWFKPPSFVVLQLGPDIRSFCDAPVEPKWRKCVFYHICWHWGVISGPTHTQVCLKTKLFPHVLTFCTHVNAISRRWKRNLWKTFACLCCLTSEHVHGDDQAFWLYHHRLLWRALDSLRLYFHVDRARTCWPGFIVFVFSLGMLTGVLTSSQMLPMTFPTKEMSL